ncbi:MAG TPA: porin [Verrucomicrobiae bacterium]|nr:porin [Verrucomicrobiae bacterium]
MKMVKSLILGSAAGLLAMSGAQAADLPVKAKAVEYVRICSLYGAGFFYIPGTDTCIKLGGYLRVDTTFNGGVYGQPAWNGDLGQRNRYFDYYASRSRMALTIDTRTATEYGVVRTFGQGDFQFNNAGYTTNPAVLTAPGTNSNLLSGAGGGYVAVEMVFIQFAGFTFGKSASAYATPWHGYPGNNNSYLMGGHDTVTGVNNIQYTAQFGNGVSGTIGLDDPTVFNRTVLGNLTTVNAFAAGTQGYGGTHSPDLVANLRVDQAWGLFQLSGALHENNAAYNAISGTAGAEVTGHPETKWGGSVMAALQIKNIPTGPGDDFKIDASYAIGDTKNVISTSGGSPSFLMYGGTGLAGAYQSVGFGATSDSTFLPVAAGGDGSIHLTRAWGVRGAFNHNWDPYWSTSIFGSYTGVSYDGFSKGVICARIAVAPLPGSTCNPDFNTAQIGAVTRWTPVKNLTFSAEVGAFFLDQKMTGTSVLPGAPPKPTAVYEFKDQSTVFLNVRAQRNF